MALTDDDGDVVNDYDYDVFGGLRDSSGSQDNDFTFAGEQVDGSTGLQYLRARYYDQNIGRFFSKDPFAGFVRLPSSQNQYPFVMNNPAVLVDPLGLFPPKVLSGVVGSVADAARDLYHERKAAVQDQFSRDVKDIKDALADAGDFLESFATRECLQAGISIAATASSFMGPQGLLVSMALTGLNMTIDVKEGDFLGATRNEGSLLVRAGTYSRQSKLFSLSRDLNRVGGMFATIDSASNCLSSRS